MSHFAKSEIEGSLPARFEAQVRHSSGQAALRCSGLSMTYGELNRCANRLARQLLPQTEAEPLPVLLLIGHGALEVIALLAVLKSGRAYVALDPQAPLARLRQIATDAGAERVLNCRTHADLAGGLAIPALELPDAAALLAAVRDPVTANDADVNLQLDIHPGTLASLVYTSGSTGTPKGVMRSHRCSLHRSWLFQLDQHVGPGDRIAHMFSCGFVAAEVDVYGALLNGGTLCCYPTRELGFAPLAEWLAAEGISLLHPPPALWRQFLDSLEQPLQLPALRTVFLAGEAVFRQDVERIRQRLPGCAIEHRLSCSEASALARYRITTDTKLEGEVMPVGSPVPDKELLLLDPTGREVPQGEVGEIVVQSRYLAPGYWRQPELTAEKFIPVPCEGNEDALPQRRFHTGDLGRFEPGGGLLFHLGRRDEQVKIRGYRIEPREVEAVLLGIEMIESAAVVPRPGPAGEKSLIACIVLRPGSAIQADELRSRLAETLPDYMIPSRFEFRVALPLTANGKIDRLALADSVPAAQSSPTSAPCGVMEESIARIWRDVLRIEQVGRSDNFFTLGGNSLLAARVMARMNKTFHLALPLLGFYQAPTIAGLAILADRGSATAPSGEGKKRKDLALILSMLEKF